MDYVTSIMQYIKELFTEKRTLIIEKLILEFPSRNGKLDTLNTNILAPMNI